MKSDEQVLTIASDIIFKEERWQGLKRDNLDYYLDLIKKYSQFKLRKDVESDKSFQQIIPYIIFNFKNQYSYTFLTLERKNGSKWTGLSYPQQYYF